MRGFHSVDKDIRHWLALSRVKGLERFSLSGVFERFGSPADIFAQSRTSLGLFSAEFAKSIEAFDSWDWGDKEMRLVEERSVDVIGFTDQRYPPLLRQICDPPCMLYAKGSAYDPLRPAVSIVGTRRPSHYGLRMAETIARELAGAGVVVVSGMARGCDGAAHIGALSAKGFTVAVLGTGVDLAYPKEHEKLYGQIAENGLVLSEYPLSTPPLPHNFPRRNRIISGLAHGVLVVEAPLRSGSLMTARLALDYNREVFAVPGQAASPKSSGVNRLIKDGAALVESAADVMEALSLTYRPPEVKVSQQSALKLSSDERVVYKALGTELLHIDDIAGLSAFPVIKVSSLLLSMELRGLVEQKPGKCFLRKF